MSRAAAGTGALDPEAHRRARAVGADAPALVAGALFLAAVAWLVATSIRLNDGRFIYALDDAYIHMATARTLALSGVWGVSPDGFTSSSSSLIWPLLLAPAFWLPAGAEWMPLILNAVFGVGAIGASARGLREAGVAPGAATVALVAVVFVTPMPALAITGMEHLLHAWLTIAFALAAIRLLVSPERPRGRPLVLLTGMAALLVSTRFEGAFLVGLAGGLFLLKRDVRTLAVLGVAAVLPIAIYGAISTAQGWLFLPNSIVLKSSAGTGRMLGLIGLYRLEQHPVLLLLVSAVAVLGTIRVLRTGSWRDPSALLSACFLAPALAHCQLADLGWFFRYEAYLIALGLVALAVGLSRALGEAGAWRRLDNGRLPAAAFALVLVAVAFYPFGKRARDAQRMAVTATRNIYEQQIQMARFLDRHYDGRPVALNDIGAVSYFADVALLDVYGLASLEVARLKLDRAFDSGALHRLVRERDVEIAIVYDAWLAPYGGAPRDWTKVAEWGIRNNVVCGDDRVSFYGVTPEAGARLRERLEAFAAEMPRTVRVTWTAAGPVARAAPGG